MKTTTKILTAALTLALVACGQPQTAEDSGAYARFDWFEYSGQDPVFEGEEPGTYINPVLAGFYPDPSLEQVGGDYYLVNSSFAYFPGIPIFHSRDLVNWTQIGNAIHRPEQLDFANLGLSRGVFAPAITYHQGIFYLLSTCVDCGGNFVVTATDPAGPWSDPVWLPEMGGIDPSLFFDDDGRAYIINNDAPIGEPLYDGHRALWVQEFNPRELKLIGPRKMVVNGGADISQKPIWIEGPHFFRREGQLYLISAEGGTAVEHSQVVFKADSPFGPFTPWDKNPILTQRHLHPERPHPITSVGHADFVQDAEGNWWATFLGVRPYEGDYYNTGRETFLMPVHWEDGWPVITRDEELVPYRAARPALPPQPAPEIPLSGNFTLREEFHEPQLKPHWMFLRQPLEENWHDLASEAGTLKIRARDQALGDSARPSFIARRQQHMHAQASTAMRYHPTQPGDRAGLAAFQSDDFFYFFGLELGSEGETRLVVNRRAGAGQNRHGEPIASTPLITDSETPLHLRIQARADRYDFLYSLDGEKWELLLEGADGKLLSTRRAGGFVGATFGVYAYRAEH